MASKTDKVRVYYVGGLPSQEGQPIAINVRGRVYVAPPVGDYLYVDAWVAKYIIQTTQIQVGNSFYPTFTTDPRVAKAAVQKGDKPEAAYTPSFTRDELVAMLAALDAEEQVEEKPEETLVEQVEEPVSEEVDLDRESIKAALDEAGIEYNPRASTKTLAEMLKEVE